MSIHSVPAEDAYTIDLKIPAHQYQASPFLKSYSVHIERTYKPHATMPVKKRPASASLSAPNTPRKRGRPATQNSSTPRSSLRSGQPASTPKASGFIDESKSTQKSGKSSQTKTGRRKASSSADSTNESAEDDYETVPFTIEFPAKPMKRNAEVDEYREKDGEQFGIGMNYIIKPTRWGDMRSFGVVKYQGVELRVGDFAYFAKNVVEPRELSEEEILASKDPLQDERENNYLAMVAEARAEERTSVYLRVMYAYWPEELPQGRQPYHGMKEVVMSNHMDIKDAHTIVGKVDVVNLDDSFESVDGIYWRQTLDLGKYPPGKGKPPGVLSKLQGHCRCGQPMNPDQTMYICRYCTLSNHDHCLIDNVLSKAWERYKAGILGPDDDEDTAIEPDEEDIEVALHQTTKTPAISHIKNTGTAKLPDGHKPATVNVQENGVTHNNTSNTSGLQLDGATDVEVSKAPSAKAGRKRKGRGHQTGELSPWYGKLSATIDSTGKFGKAGLVIVRIAMEDSGEVLHTSVLSCLRCSRRFD